MTPMHPDAERLMALVRATGRPAFETLTPEEARTAYAAGRLVLQPAPEDVADVEDHMVARPGGPLLVRRYRGVGAPDPAPALLYLHGGGWVMGSIASHDGVCRRLANLAACHVVSVEYRLAPEHPFPAAIEDAQAGLAWLAEAPGVDRARLAVGGDSAGGNLAAVLALMGRDGTVPRTAFQMLLYPATDLAMATGSYARNTADVPLTAGTMRYFVDHYAPTAADRVDWRASPAVASSLAGTPPAFVLTVGHDPLADEGRAYAARLEAEGVRVAALHLSDQVHGMLTMGRVILAGDVALRTAALAMMDAWRVC